MAEQYDLLQEKIKNSQGPLLERLRLLELEAEKMKKSS
jgi:hypothetical protein